MACASFAAESVLRSSGAGPAPSRRNLSAPEWLIAEKRTGDAGPAGAQRCAGRAGAAVVNDGVDAGKQPVMRSARDEVNSGRTRADAERAAACGEQSALSCQSERFNDHGGQRAGIDPRHAPEPDIQGRLSCIEEGREFGVRPPAVAIEKPIAGHQHVLSPIRRPGDDVRAVGVDRSGRLPLTSGAVQAERRATPVADHSAEQQTRAVNRQAVADAIERSKRRERQHRTRERRRRREAR